MYSGRISRGISIQINAQPLNTAYHLRFIHGRRSTTGRTANDARRRADSLSQPPERPEGRRSSPTRRSTPTLPEELPLLIGRHTTTAVSEDITTAPALHHFTEAH